MRNKLLEESAAAFRCRKLMLKQREKKLIERKKLLDQKEINILEQRAWFNDTTCKLQRREKNLKKRGILLEENKENIRRIRRSTRNLNARWRMLNFDWSWLTDKYKLFQEEVRSFTSQKLELMGDLKNLYTAINSFLEEEDSFNRVKAHQTRCDTFDSVSVGVKRGYELRPHTLNIFRFSGKLLLRNQG